MTATIGRRVGITSTLVFALLATTAGTVSASCAEPIPFQQAFNEAHTVFVGTVTGLEHGGRVATFQVDEVWKGDAGATAVVNGGPTLAEIRQAADEGLEIYTSNDRIYDAGGRYLVVAGGIREGMFTDNGCTHTQPYTADLDQFRPTVVHAPLTPTDRVPDSSGLSGWGWAGLTALAIGSVAAAGWAVQNRRHRAPRAITT